MSTWSDSGWDAKVADAVRRGKPSRSAEFASGATHPPVLRQTVKGQSQDSVTFDGVSDVHTDEDLARHAGFSDRHHGYGVQRFKDDSSATVNLWKA